MMMSPNSQQLKVFEMVFEDMGVSLNGTPKTPPNDHFY